MEEYQAEIKGLQKQAGVSEILLPGELELKKEEESRRRGIELPEAVAKAINEVLSKVGSDRRIPEATERVSQS
jgi:LDH2 family malate/lactate/ureidoglycolate dehydrogenase